MRFTWPGYHLEIRSKKIPSHKLCERNRSDRCHGTWTTVLHWSEPIEKECMSWIHGAANKRRCSSIIVDVVQNGFARIKSGRAGGLSAEKTSGSRGCTEFSPEKRHVEVTGATKHHQGRPWPSRGVYFRPSIVTPVSCFWDIDRSRIYVGSRKYLNTRRRKSLWIWRCTYFSTQLQSIGRIVKRFHVTSDYRDYDSKLAD